MFGSPVHGSPVDVGSSPVAVVVAAMASSSIPAIKCVDSVSNCIDSSDNFPSIAAIFGMCTLGVHSNREKVCLHSW